MNRPVPIALALLLLFSSAAVAAENVDIPRGEAHLHAALFRPAGAGPFPAVVALHACDGLMDGQGAVRQRYRDWGEELAAAGFVVLFPDSYGSRGLGPQCAVQKRRLSASRDNAGDADAARLWLQRQADVRADRVSLLGFATGGVAALWAVRPRRAAGGGNDFRSAVAFYPGCRRLGSTAWSARIPTLILIGAQDDWTPARDCQQMVSGARGRSAGASIVVYPGAFHGFDQVKLPLQRLTGMAFTPDGTGRAHIGGNHAARIAAIKRTVAWLAR